MSLELPPQVVTGDGIVVQVKQRDVDAGTALRLVVHGATIGGLVVGPESDASAMLVEALDVALPAYRRAQTRRKRLLGE